LHRGRSFASYRPAQHVGVMPTPGPVTTTVAACLALAGPVGWWGLQRQPTPAAVGDPWQDTGVGELELEQLPGVSAPPGEEVLRPLEEVLVPVPPLEPPQELVQELHAAELVEASKEAPQDEVAGQPSQTQQLLVPPMSEAELPQDEALPWHELLAQSGVELGSLGAFSAWWAAPWILVAFALLEMALCGLCLKRCCDIVKNYRVLQAASDDQPADEDEEENEEEEEEDSALSPTLLSSSSPTHGQKAEPTKDNALVREQVDPEVADPGLAKQLG